jgi:hypothetical protein
MGIECSERAYRFTPGGKLPKFGTGKNPFRGDKAAAARKAQAAPEVAAAPATTASPPSEDIPAKPLKATLGAVAAPARASALASRLRGAVGNLILMFRRSRPGNVFVRPLKARREPVQGELLLDRVQVMRNDLSDADVEVVAAKPSGVAPAETSVRRPLGPTLVTSSERERPMQREGFRA